MHYFVTGATGFIGGRLARMLREKGDAVTALVRDPTRAEHLSRLGIALCPGDITDRASVEAGMRGVDGVFHCAAWYKLGVRGARTAEAVNVDGTRNVLEAMRDRGIPRGVYTSTLAVFSDTHGVIADETYRTERAVLSVYERTKWSAHYEVALPMMEKGLPLTIVQPGVTYGPGDAGPVRDTVRQYLAGRLPVLPSRTSYCWAHVEDTADGHIRAMEQGKSGESYIIAGPIHTLIGVFELAERVTGVPAPRIHTSPGMMRAGASIMSLLERLVPIPTAYSSESLRSTAGTTYTATSEKAQTEIGFHARPLEEGWPETVKYERAEMKEGR